MQQQHRSRTTCTSCCAFFTCREHRQPVLPPVRRLPCKHNTVEPNNCRDFTRPKAHRLHHVPHVSQGCKRVAAASLARTTYVSFLATVCSCTTRTACWTEGWSQRRRHLPVAFVPKQGARVQRSALPCYARPQARPA